MTDQVLAQQIATVLLPALPYLLKGAKIAGKKAAETLGEESIKTIWEKIKARGRVRQAAQAAVDLPENPVMKDGLAHEIAAVLQSDPRLAAELKNLLGTAGIQVQNRSVNIKGNVIGGVINTGDNNTITR